MNTVRELRGSMLDVHRAEKVFAVSLIQLKDGVGCKIECVKYNQGRLPPITQTRIFTDTKTKIYRIRTRSAKELTAPE